MSLNNEEVKTFSFIKSHSSLVRGKQINPNLKERFMRDGMRGRGSAFAIMRFLHLFLIQVIKALVVLELSPTPNCVHDLINRWYQSVKEEGRRGVGERRNINQIEKVYRIISKVSRNHFYQLKIVKR